MRARMQHDPVIRANSLTDHAVRGAMARCANARGEKKGRHADPGVGIPTFYPDSLPSRPGGGIPSFFMRFRSVLGLMPSSSAAPSGVTIR